MAGISSVKSAVYESSSANIVHSHSGRQDKGSVAIKAGDFLLNGKKITIEKGDSLKSISTKINNHSHHTGIKAKIVEQSNGYRLHLVSKSRPVEIQDKNAVLLHLYNKGYIGKNSKHLIQVTGGEILYNKSSSRQLQSSRTLGDMLRIFKLSNTGSNPLVVLNEVPVDLDDDFYSFESDSDSDSFYSFDSDSVEDSDGDIFYGFDSDSVEDSDYEADMAGEEVLAPVVVEEAVVVVPSLIPLIPLIPLVPLGIPVVVHPLLAPHPPLGDPEPTQAEIQEALVVAAAKIEAGRRQEAEIKATNLIDASLKKVVKDKELINTLITSNEYSELFDSLNQALVNKFSLERLKDNKVALEQRLAKNLNKHRNWSPIANKFEIDAVKIVFISNRIKNYWDY